MQKKHLLLILLILKSIFLLIFISQGWIGLGPDEAQYWTWSQDLSLGYYSKPPGIAWQIYLGTLLFGNTELGVRFVSVIIGFFIPLAIFCLGKLSGFTERASFLGSVAFAFSPLGFLSSFFAITDVGSVFFFTYAFIVLMKGFQTGETNYKKAGVLVALGALFKWVTYYFWFFAFASLLLKKGKLRDFVLGVLISLLGLVPSLIWNIQNGFVTFLHVYYQAGSKGDLAPNKTLISLKSFLDFIGAEIALVSPLLFVLLVIALFSRPKDKAAKFLQLSTGVTLAFFGGLSLFMKIQGNWCDFIYPVGFAYLGWYYEERRGWVYAGTILSVVLTLFLFIGSHQIPIKNNPFKHNLGWDHLEEALNKSGYDEEKHFLFAPKYQTVSLLSFYGPKQKRAYFLNLYGARLNQFSFWPGMKDEQKGRSGYFVLTDPPENAMEDLKPYFKKVTFAGEYPLFQTKKATIYFAEDFTGEEPKPLEKY